MTPQEIVEATEDATIGCKSCYWIARGPDKKTGITVPICDAGQAWFPNGGKGICSWYKPKTKGRRRVA